MRILSVDVSTTTIGYAIFDNGKLIHCDYYKPNKKNGKFAMLDKTIEWFNKLLKKYKPDEVVVEDIIKHMMGKSRADTVIILSVINRIIGLTWYKFSGKEPHLLNINKIRSVLKIDGRLKKEDVPMAIEHHLGVEFPWVTRYIKKTGEHKICTESYDVADGIAVGVAYLKLNESI